MKSSDTISHKDEFLHEMTNQRIIHTGNFYQKMEWQETETSGVQWYSSHKTKEKMTRSIVDETDTDKKYHSHSVHETTIWQQQTESLLQKRDIIEYTDI